MDWQRLPNSRATKSAFRAAKAACQAAIRCMKEKWFKERASESEDYARSNKAFEFYKSLKAIYGPSTRGPVAIRATDGTLLTDSTSILARWKEHFEKLLNRDSFPDWEVLRSLPQEPIQVHLDAPPSLSEVDLAIRQLKLRKSPGCDGIPAEIYKVPGCNLLNSHLLAIFEKIWKEEAVPQDLKDASIVSIFKNKGNFRGISLLSIAGKVLSKLLLKRLMPVSESFLP